MANLSISEVLTLILDICMLFVQFTYRWIESIVNIFRQGEGVSVKDELVLITGTGHGIGKELALQYSALGAKLVCVDINEQTNNETVKEVNARGGKAVGYVCDISNREKVFELCDKVKREVGSVTILVNNAGIMPCKPLMDHGEGEIRKMFDINVMAHFWTMQAFGKDMMSKNKGHIIALSSMAGIMGFRNLVPYCGSKFAVRGLMEAFADELRLEGAENVKFTTIYPYMVDTGLCHKPVIRFENVMKLVKPNDAAAAIINAQRLGLPEATIPRYLFYSNLIFRLFPVNCALALKDFFNTGVDRHDD